MDCSSGADWVHRYIAAVIFALTLPAFASCTPTTGTRIALSQPKLREIRSIAVSVKKAEEFSVRLSRQEMTGTGAVLGSPFGLVGALIGTGIEAGGRQSADRAIEREFLSLVSNFDPAQELNHRLIDHLNASKFFEAVASSHDTKEDPPAGRLHSDGVLFVTIKEWGLRRCLGPISDKVQIAFSVEGNLTETGGSLIWQREELYLDGTCEGWASFQSPTLVKSLSHVIDNLAGKLVNEVVYP